MKISLFCVLGGLLCGWSVEAFASGPDPIPVRYEVAFKGMVVATQTITGASADGLVTITTSFEADLPVFVALQHYSEQLSVTFRADGMVERSESVRIDGPFRTETAGTLLTNGLLQIVRTDPDGGSTNYIARQDYDLNSLVLYGTAPADFLPTNSPARVLSVAEGRVVPVSIQKISESETTPERQHLTSTHLIWTEGIHTSHSWHPEHYGNLPHRYIRQTKDGEFTFTLIQ